MCNGVLVTGIFIAYSPNDYFDILYWNDVNFMYIDFICILHYILCMLKILLIISLKKDVHVYLYF